MAEPEVEEEEEEPDEPEEAEVPRFRILSFIVFISLGFTRQAKHPFPSWQN